MLPLLLLLATADALPQQQPSSDYATTRTATALHRPLLRLRAGAADEEGAGQPPQRDPSLLQSLSSLKDLLAALDDRVKQQPTIQPPPTAPKHAS